MDRGRRGAGWERIRPRVRRLHPPRVPRGQGFSEGAIEMYGVMNFVEAGINNAVVGGVPRGLRQGLRGHAGDRRRHGQPAERVLPRAAGRDPLRRRGPRDRPGHRSRDGPLQDRVRPVLGDRRLRDRHDPVLGAAPGRGHHAVLAREAARDPPAQLRGLDQGPVPGPRADLGDRRRHLRRRDRHRPADPADELPDARPGRRRAACCSRATRGARTRPAGARWTRRRASRRRSRTSRRSIRGSGTSTRSARRTPGTTTASRAARSRCSSRASRRSSRRTSCGRRAGSTSPASTARCTTPGSRAPSSPACAPRARSTSMPAAPIGVTRVPARRRERRPDAAPGGHLDPGQRRRRAPSRSACAGACSRPTAAARRATARPSPDPDADWTVRVDVGGLQPDTTLPVRLRGRRRALARRPDAHAPGRRPSRPCASPGLVRQVQRRLLQRLRAHRRARRHRLPAPPRRLHLRGVATRRRRARRPEPDIGRPFDPLHECVTLDDYRTRYAQYRRDPDVQAVQRRATRSSRRSTTTSSPTARGATAPTEHKPERDGPWADRKAARVPGARGVAAGPPAGSRRPRARLPHRRRSASLADLFLHRHPDPMRDEPVPPPAMLPRGPHRARAASRRRGCSPALAARPHAGGCSATRR